ncbi:HAD hydrolase-like protein [Corynebacterium sp. MNWGS58]|uniref:HAD hydrolase-like protein n=1 Tax=Corynebacterium sp. 102791.4 TaxID=3104612 RepID=UPI00351661CF
MDILDITASLVENLGKPSELGVSILADRGLVIEDSLVIGDNADTDGVLARAIGVDFLLFHAHHDGR